MKNLIIKATFKNILLFIHIICLFVLCACYGKVPGELMKENNSIFIHPLDNSKVLLSNTNTSDSNISAQGIYAFVSNEYGNPLSWTYNQIPDGAEYSNTAIDRKGRYYIAYTEEDENFISKVQGLSYSTDEGETWEHVNIKEYSSGVIPLQGHLWVDNSEFSLYEGNLYCVWTEMMNDVVLSISIDQGEHWSEAMNIFPGDIHTYTPKVQTNSDGDLFIMSLSQGGWINFAKLTNGGQDISFTDQVVNINVSSRPGMAIDNYDRKYNEDYKDNIYIVWGEQTENDLRDIYMIKSSNDGESWSEKIRINQDGYGNQQYFPFITCDPETGSVYIIFYDNRDTQEGYYSTWVASSHDGGETWFDEKVSFNEFKVPVSMDYIGISARGNIVYTAWQEEDDSGFKSAYVRTFLVPQLPVIIPLPIDPGLPVLTLP